MADVQEVLIQNKKRIFFFYVFPILSDLQYIKVAVTDTLHTKDLKNIMHGF